MMYHITAIRVDQPHDRWKTSFRCYTLEQAEDSYRSFVGRGYKVTVHEYKHNFLQDKWEWVPMLLGSGPTK